MLTIFCDGVFDLFHIGHLNHLKKIREHFDETIYLIVGVINDNISTPYKRKPIFNEKKRSQILNSCMYTDKVILMDNLIITEKFLNKHKIDFVVHAFANKADVNKQEIIHKSVHLRVTFTKRKESIMKKTFL